MAAKIKKKKNYEIFLRIIFFGYLSRLEIFRFSCFQQSTTCQNMLAYWRHILSRENEEVDRF